MCTSTVRLLNNVFFENFNVNHIWCTCKIRVLRILMFIGKAFMFKESKFQEKHVRILVFNEETCTCMKLRDNYLCFIMSFSGDHVS